MTLLRLTAALIAALFAASAAMAQSETFASWRSGFTQRAVAAGHSRALVQEMLAGVEPNMRAIELDRSQPEHVRPIWEYLDSAASETRIENGREYRASEASLLADLRTRYGVDPEALVAIWALESNYGSFIGDNDVVRALATLAWEGRRRALFEGELMAVLEILASGRATRDQLVGGWAGAMGMTQFMPSSYLRFAVDNNGDGRMNVWSDRGDALGSAANYLSHYGWRTGEPWGVEVRLPDGFDYSLADDRRMNVGAWAATGVTRYDHAAWSADEQFRSARLLLPAGARGPAFLIYDNFNVIMRYNNATSYALAAGILMDQIEGRPGVQAPWPRDEVPLTRTQSEEMQRLLTNLGFDTGGVDGIIGPNSRDALRRWQAARGLPADAFASISVLTRLRQESAN